MSLCHLVVVSLCRCVTRTGVVLSFCRCVVVVSIGPLTWYKDTLQFLTDHLTAARDLANDIDRSLAGPSKVPYTHVVELFRRVARLPMRLPSTFPSHRLRAAVAEAVQWQTKAQAVLAGVDARAAKGRKASAKPSDGGGGAGGGGGGGGGAPGGALSPSATPSGGKGKKGGKKRDRASMAGGGKSPGAVSFAESNDGECDDGDGGLVPGLAASSDSMPTLAMVRIALDDAKLLKVAMPEVRRMERRRADESDRLGWMHNIIISFLLVG